jgi:hypothetical protein
MMISIKGTGKYQLDPGEKSMRNAPVLSHCSSSRNPWPNRPVCWSIVVKENPTVGYPFFWAFPSDRIPKATKGVNVHFFIHNFPEISLGQRFQYITHEFSEDFEATAHLFACVRELLACANIYEAIWPEYSLGSVSRTCWAKFIPFQL